LRRFREDKNGNEVALISEYEMGTGLLVEIGNPSYHQCKGRSLELRQVEGERDSPLKPRFHRVPVSGDDFHWVCAGESRHMEIRKFG
jgi:hypothetical protein